MTMTSSPLPYPTVPGVPVGTFRQKLYNYQPDALTTPLQPKPDVFAYTPTQRQIINELVNEQDSPQERAQLRAFLGNSMELSDSPNPFMSGAETKLWLMIKPTLEQELSRVNPQYIAQYFATPQNVRKPNWYSTTWIEKAFPQTEALLNAIGFMRTAHQGMIQGMFNQYGNSNVPV